MQTTTLLSNFKADLKDSFENLAEYAKKPTASQFYIDKTNEKLARLTSYYNRFSSQEHFDMWLEMEKQMHDLLSKDTSLQGFQTVIRLSEKGNNFGLITSKLPDYVRI